MKILVFDIFETNDHSIIVTHAIQQHANEIASCGFDSVITMRFCMAKMSHTQFTKCLFCFSLVELLEELWLRLFTISQILHGHHTCLQVPEMSYRFVSWLLLVFIYQHPQRISNGRTICNRPRFRFANRQK